MSSSLVWFFLIWTMFIFPILLLTAPHWTLQLAPSSLQFTNALYSFYKYLRSIDYTLATMLSLGNPEVNVANMAHLHRVYSWVLQEFTLLFTAPSCPPHAWRTLLNFQSSLQGWTLSRNPTCLLPPDPHRRTWPPPGHLYTLPSKLN